jgi:hypothetical protein
MFMSPNAPLKSEYVVYMFLHIYNIFVYGLAYSYIVMCVDMLS